MLQPNFYREKRPWGSYTLFADNQKCSVKILKISGQLSLQSHQHREEKWYVISGEVMVYCGPVRSTLPEIKEHLKEYRLREGENIFIPRNYVHSMKNLAPQPSLVLEISEGEYREEDIVRYEDVYGRVK
jgi:mannose-6-phosphate isomerase-like protein (cupin superfamily)